MGRTSTMVSNCSRVVPYFASVHASLQTFWHGSQGAWLIEQLGSQGQRANEAGVKLRLYLDNG